MFYDDKMLTRLGWEEELRRQSLETFEVSVPGQAPGSPDTRRCWASRRTSSGRGWGTWATGSRRRWSTWQLSPSPSLLYSGEMRDSNQNYFPRELSLQCCHILFPGAVSDRAGSVDHPAGVPGELLHHHGRPVAGGEEQVRLELLQGGMYQGDIPLLEGQSLIW